MKRMILSALAGVLVSGFAFTPTEAISQEVTLRLQTVQTGNMGNRIDRRHG